MSLLWTSCDGASQLRQISINVWRMVESQTQVASMSLVDSLVKQNILEQLIETTKPAPAELTADKHYLITTPFRYPPLKHGSRFGTRYERGIFYASLSVHAMLAEGAYYRLLFWQHQQTPYSEQIKTEHTAFRVRVDTERGIALQHPPFNQYQSALRDPCCYQATQALGSAMRQAGVDAFSYVSARDPGKHLNIGIFTPAAITSKKPLQTRAWHCLTDSHTVFFADQTGEHKMLYSQEDFMCDGVFPGAAV